MRLTSTCLSREYYPRLLTNMPRARSTEAEHNVSYLLYTILQSFSFQDESERIRNMGGVVVHCMGVLRVNGFLSISRAIGK